MGRKGGYLLGAAVWSSNCCRKLEYCQADAVGLSEAAAGEPGGATMGWSPGARGTGFILQLPP